MSYGKGKYPSKKEANWVRKLRREGFSVNAISEKTKLSRYMVGKVVYPSSGQIRFLSQLGVIPDTIEGIDKCEISPIIDELVALTEDGKIYNSCSKAEYDTDHLFEKETKTTRKATKQTTVTKTVENAVDNSNEQLVKIFDTVGQLLNQASKILSSG